MMINTDNCCYITLQQQQNLEILPLPTPAQPDHEEEEKEEAIDDPELGATEASRIG